MERSPPAAAVSARAPPSAPGDPPPLWRHQLNAKMRDRVTVPMKPVKDVCEPYWSQGQHCVNTDLACKLEVLADLVITPNSCASLSFCACDESAIGICTRLPGRNCAANARICPLESDYCARPPIVNSYSYDTETIELPQCRAFTPGKPQAF